MHTPIKGNNIAYAAHPYHFNWNSWLQNQIATVAARYPVVLTEFGYTDGFEWFGPVIKEFAQKHNLHWTAWVLSHNWGPPMFVADASKRELRHFGQFIKDWLAEEASGIPHHTPLPEKLDVVSGRSDSLAIIGARATESQDGNPPQNSLDGSGDTRWAANGNHSITYDLGGVKSITDISIAFFNANTRSYTFSIDVSVDGSEWTEVLTARSTRKAPFETFAFENVVSAKYVRYNGRGNSDNSWNSFFHFEVHGE